MTRSGRCPLTDESVGGNIREVHASAECDAGLSRKVLATSGLSQRMEVLERRLAHDVAKEERGPVRPVAPDLVDMCASRV